MPIKTVVGAVVYREDGKIFLMRSHKWHDFWLVPGGRIEKDETEEQALHREIMEELGIRIDDVHKLGSGTKPASKDFYIPEMEFHMTDYCARALSTKIIPNEEITEWKWFTIAEAMKLNLLDATRGLLERYAKYRKSWSGR